MNLQQQKLCCIVHVFCIFVFCLLFASALLQGIHFLCNLCTFLQVVLFVHFFCWMCNFAVHFCRVCSFSAFLLWSVYFLCTSAFLQGVLFGALLLQGVFFVHFCISVGCTFLCTSTAGCVFLCTSAAGCSFCTLLLQGAHFRQFLALQSCSPGGRYQRWHHWVEEKRTEANFFVTKKLSVLQVTRYIGPLRDIWDGIF